MKSLLATCIVLAVVLTIAATATHAAERPNVILILADDMAPGDFASANGGLSRTPHLDRLAKQSVAFDQAYSASCVCAPARAALLTGRYPHRTGVVTLNMNRYPELTRLRHDETTIAEVLGASGYATGLIGKWHCGAGSDYSPLRHGFDEFEGFSGSQDLSYFKYSLQENQEMRDVVDDPAEVNDLSKDHPERTAQMNKALTTWSQSVEADRVRETTRSASGTPGETLLRVLSYNIHHAEGVDRNLDLERIARVILSVRPDLVALQEVDQQAKRSKSIDQPAELARLTKMNVVFGANIELQGGHYGNAVLSRFPVIRQQNHFLPTIDDGEQRGVIEAEIQIPSQKDALVFLATHLDHRRDDRERQASAEAINKLIAKHPQRSMILAGDLNAVLESKTLDRLKSMWTSVNERPIPTIPVKRPTKQIDFILYRPQTRWEVVEVNVLDEAVASDHRAILAILKRMPEGSSF